MDRRTPAGPAGMTAVARKERVFAYVPHELAGEAARLGWLWRGPLPSPHGHYSDLWEFVCCCGRPAMHPRASGDRAAKKAL